MAPALPLDLAKVDPKAAWSQWQPDSSIPWNRKWISHLYRRAAFGASPADVDRALADGFEKTLDRLITGEPNAPQMLEFLSETGQYYQDTGQIRGWWLYMIFEGGHPLREKLTLFWHNHFATSYAKVRSTHLMFQQNAKLRSHALGKFPPFLKEMSQDTAMLVWLDSNQNIKGAPNENYAREVMELFSLGVGNYSEKDIQEAARAFTGWHHDPEVTVFDYNPILHDDGQKTLLGQTGNWGGEDVIRILLEQPTCAHFLVSKLYAFLISETAPPKDLLAPLEKQFRRSGYDVADLVRTMLASQLFFSAHAYRKRVKWPVEYVVSTVRSMVPGRVPPADLVEPLAKMGQVLFAPPNVKGWRCGTDWLNNATLLARNNFSETVSMGKWSKEGVARRNNTFTQVAPATPEPAVEELAIPMETPEQRLAGAAAAGAAAAYAPVREVVGPDGTRTMVPGYVSSFDASAPPSGAPKETQKGKSPAKAEAAVPPPDAKYDVTAVLFASKPMNVRELLKRMGEVLFGEEASPAARAKLEKFLLDGKKSITAKEMEEPAFRAKVREAVHALMCLPEYQLS